MNINFMQIAIQEAKKALSDCEVPVGCVIVREGEVIGKGYNKTNETRNATKHAEIVAIEEILFSCGHNCSIFKNCELYVTCEPCIMCAATIGNLGFKRAYFGCHNERFGGNGSILNIHNSVAGKYDIFSGVMHDEAISLFQEFYSGENKNAPLEKRKRKREVGSQLSDDCIQLEGEVEK